MKTLLKKLNKSNIKIDFIDEKLDIQAPKGVMTEDLLNEIKLHKNELIAFLNLYKTKKNKHFFIPQAPVQPFYVLSSSQRRLWLLSQFEDGNIAYNMPSVFKLKGDLSISSLQSAFLALIERHESLRTLFTENKNGEVRQVIQNVEDTQFQLRYKDFSNEENVLLKTNEIIQKEIKHSFNLSTDCLLRAKLIKTSPDSYTFILVMHHIISDGWSAEVMTNELFVLYDSFLKSRPDALPELKLQYKDYATWQQEQLKDSSIENHKSYWLEKFQGELPVLDLPTYQIRPLLKTYNGQSVNKLYNNALFENFNNLCQSQGSTLFMGVLAAVKTLLYRYTNQNDIIIGSPIAGREHVDLQNQIGFYVNTLALRTQFEGKDSFITVLSNVKDVVLGAHEHQMYPFDELVEQLSIQRDMSRNPLFDVVVTLQNTDKSIIEDSLGDITIEDHHIEEDVLSKFDLEFTFASLENGFNLVITYNKDLYTQDFIERLQEHFGLLIQTIVNQPEESIAILDYLSPQEKKQVLFDFNNTAVDFPKDKTVIDLFEQQVEKNPDNVAVSFEGKVLIYKELNEYANQLGAYLRENYSIKPDDIVGLKLERSELLIISILGVLKSGAAYVPIDPAYPQERIDYIQKDSNCKVVIDEDFLKSYATVQEKYSKQNIENINSPRDLVYVIYTSGTTGQPKGVAVEHINLINLSYWHSHDFYVTQFSRGTLFSGVGFDASVWEIFPYLLSGASLYPIKENDVRLDLKKLTDFYILNEISHSYLPSAICGSLVNSGVSINKVKFLVGGEALKIEKPSSLEIYNNYGPTENTVVSTFYKVSHLDTGLVSIGKPISNTQVLILDEYHQPLPVGVLGKLFVSGAGVARGYLNKAELTAEKFTDNPFAAGQKMYDTGDLGRWLPDGNIEFYGRKDHQVKIRGYRVELGEIENATLQYSESLQQVVVDVKELNQEKVLVAYYVSPTEVDKSLLRSYLQGLLPDYMVPGFYVALEKLPLTPNGKTDRKSLPDISGENVVRKEYVAPGNETEQQLVAIWQEVLGIEGIGITDNFFELGGHSLIVAQVINRIYKQLGTTISFRDFFSVPTISGLSIRMTSSDYVKIPLVPVSDSYPLSASQNRLWLLSQLEGGSLAYNMPAGVELKGAVDVLKFKESFDLLMARHEILRTSFRANKQGEVRQFIAAQRDIEFEIAQIDFTGSENQENLVSQYLDQQNNKVFDLENAPLVRASLITLQADHHIFFLSLHHIIGDGWSMELLISEVIKTYNLLKEGRSAVLPELPIQYKDYAGWMNDEVKKDKYKDSEEYWLNEFSGTLPVLELPAFKARSLVQTYKGHTIRHEFPKGLLEKIKNFSQAHDATLFMTLMSAIKVLLYRYSGQQDIITGTPIAGREHPDLENQIGLFLNTLAIRSHLDQNDSFLEVLEKEKQTLLNAYEHQNYPFDVLVGKLNLKRDTSRSALFDVLVVLQSQGQLNNVNTEELTDLEISNYDLKNTNSKFDITYTFVEKDGLSLSINYNTAIYDLLLIERMFVHLENLLSVSLQTPELEIGRIDYLSAQEKKQVLFDFNDTAVDFAKDKTIIDLFEEQAEKNPDTIAVFFGDNVLTYKELSEQSNQLGAYLTENYLVKPEDLIGIKLERSDRLIVAILGILKSGAAYVPIDPSYPQERISYIEKDSNCKVVIDEDEYGKFYSNRSSYNVNNQIQRSKPNDLVYVIYTSGTTGKPKGVMIENRNLVNYILHQISYLKIVPEEKIALLSSISFDASVEQVFTALLSSSSLYVITKEEILDSDKLENIITENSITHLHGVPSLLLNLKLDSHFSLKRIVSAGENFKKELANRYIDKCELYNKYGPTEVTISSAISHITNKEIISIGKPIANTQIYILNDNLSPVSVGTTGRLFISGAGVARGYLNNAELTAEKFTDNPFAVGQKMYDTGDLGRWLPDGNIELLGRKDYQVKIRGNRIELEEIENTLSNYGKFLKEVVVDVKELNQEKVLVAYYVSQTEVDKSLLRSYLQGLLPDYMVPGFYVALEKLPLTPNGKTDRKSLPDISGENVVRKEYVPAGNETEQQLVAIWQEVLGIEGIGITDNFFELGGHSLIVAQVINRIYKQLGTTISFRDFFAQPTISGLSSRMTSSDYVKIPLIPVSDSYALSASQNRLWLLSQLEGGSLAYNMPAGVELKGAVDLLKFKESFDLLMARHEILRTSFRVNKQGEVRQFIAAQRDVEFEIAQIDFTGAENQENLVAQYLDQQNNKVFDLENAPLVRASLITLQADHHIFFLSLHHIIGDGWSMELLISEVIKTYNLLKEGRSAVLPELPIQYKDYAGWMNNEVKKDKYKDSEQYWLNEFSGTLPVLELPAFKARPLVQTYAGHTIRHEFPTGLLEKIKNFSQAHDATLFMTLMSAIKVLLYRYSGQEDIITGTPIAGREHPDLENQIGLFLNTLAIRSHLDQNDSFVEVLEKEKQTLLNAYEHQNYPFDVLVGKLNLKRDTSRSALFDVLVVLQSQGQLNNVNTEELTDLEISNYDLKNTNSKFDITYTFVEKDGLSLSINYNTAIYDSLLIERMFVHLENLLSVSLQTPELEIGRIDYLSVQEKKQVLFDFNDTAADFAKDKTIIDLFEEQAEKNPDTIAIVFGENVLTYKELNEQSNQLGAYLTENYLVKPEDLIGIKLERSDRLIVAILGILKSGAAYVPIDPSYPQERISYIEKDSNCKVVADDDFFELYRTVQHNYSKHNFDKTYHNNNLAYIIYTSGTTGNPKGVMIKHDNAAELINWSIGEYSKSEFDIVYAVTSYCFDLSVYEIFYPLSIGKKIRILKNALEIKEYLSVDKNVLLNTVPSVIRKIIEDGTSLDTIKVINMAGEILPTDIIDKLPLDKIEIRNLYGPSEDTTYSTCYLVENNDSKSISIGKPISNTQVLILDEYHQPLPVGVLGKLFVSGAGVARGYLNKAELTAEKFTDNPFAAGQKMYDTGDLGRWLPDGNIEFSGRKDHQVKIRGYRVELGEIENATLQYSENLQQVVVDVKELNQEKVLVAYYVSPTEVDKSLLRSYLQGLLPDYMVPGFYVALEKLPLTPNGKIDRKSLPDISGENVVRKEYVPARNETEQKLVAIWQEVLGIEGIGITDNFFELGGHSLIVAQVINRIYKQLGTTISFRDFFAQPTISGLSSRMTISDYVKIPLVPVSDSYPLSASQNRLWLLSQLEGGSLAYNMPAGVELKGAVDLLKFKESFDLLMARHEILRTSFRVNKQGEVRQFIAAQRDVEFEIAQIDFTGAENQENLVAQYLDQQNNKVFDLENAPLVRASLITLQADHYIFFLSLHHIIGDGWSMEILISEVIKTYNLLKEGKLAVLAELPIQYKDYAGWMNNEVKKDKYKDSEQYWLNEFSGTLPVLELPAFKARPLVQTYAGHTIRHEFPTGLLEKIKNFSQAHDATLFMTLMSAIKVLLYRYSGQQDIITGTPIAGREHPDLENQIGLFLNTLAIRSHLDQKDSFLEVLEKEKQTLLNAYEHQNYPFDVLVGKLNLKRDTSRSALFDVLVVLQSQGQLNNLNTEELTDLKISNYDLKNTNSKFDITYTFVEKDGLSLSINYNTAIYDSLLIEHMFVHLENLLSVSLQTPELEIGRIDYLSAHEQEKLLFDFNDTAKIYTDKTILELFEDQVKTTPNAIALEFEGERITYTQLNELSNQLGCYLRSEYKIGNTDLIGIKLERSDRLVISILGVLKSGAAYVPIDSNYPQERISYIEKDTQSKVILDQAEFTSFWAKKQNYPNVNLPLIAAGSDLAYIIYTSGSTGNPKGVMINHASLTNYLLWAKDYYLSSGLRNTNFGLFTSLSFDLTITSLFLPIISGGTLKVLDSPADVPELLSTYFNSAISCVKLTPAHISILEGLNLKSSNVEIAIVGGEALGKNQVDILRSINPSMKIINEYGPTEATVGCIIYDVDPSDHNILIGKPIANTQIYILTDSVLAPIGVIGEVYISGSGLARGYLNRDDLTSEKFVAHPFKKGELMYKTGDLGRWLSDGNIEYKGRIDDQVKIRGHRIELGEIENTIIQYSKDIKQIVVEVKNNNQQKVLVAYLISSDTIDKSALKKYLENKLPDYMVPGFYVVLEKLPLTPNGKVDRKSLPEISGEDVVRKEYVPAGNETEQQLVAIWEEVLGIERIGITDNFFDLGGHSLIVGQIINRTYKQLGKTISFRDFFHQPTIKGLAHNLIVSDYVKIPLAKEAISYPLTPSQHRLWILSQFEGASLAYNMPITVKLKGKLESAKFEEAVRLLINRHEILRTSFKINEEEEISQFITPVDDVNFNFSHFDFSLSNTIDEDISNYLKQENAIPFNLEKSPILRASLLKIDKDEYILFVSIHHIIGDGWSTELLIKEIISIYNSLIQEEKIALPALNLQYKDYAVWLNNQVQKEKYQDSEEYWLNQFAGEIPAIELPGFKTRPLVKTYNGKTINYKFSNQFFEHLNAFSNKYNVTLFTTLMAGINVLLNRYSGHEDIIIGTPIAGREHPDLENQIGLYLNTLAIRTQIDKNNSFEFLLNKEKQILLDAYEHQGYSFDTLVDNLQLKRDTSRSALFDVMVVLQNQSKLNDLNSEELLNLKVSEYESFNKTAKFDLVFTFSEINSLELGINYNTDIFAESFIEKIPEHFEILLSKLIDKPQEEIHSIDYLSSAEQEQLLFDFNDTAKIYTNKTILELFEDQVKNTPHAIALEFEGESITYAELNELSNQLGGYLRSEYKIGNTDLIGIKLERSYRLVISILGVLKSGAAYVPIDSNYPQERISYIEKDTQSKVILDQAEFTSFWAKKEDYSNVNLPLIATGSDLAYIIYTSGSTGNPKGVMINHASLTNYLLWAKDYYLSSGLRNTNFGLFTSLSFDLTITSLFLPIISGGILKVLDSSADVPELLSTYFNSAISCVKLTPAHISILEGLNLKSSNVEIAIVGGEALGKNQVDILRSINPSMKIINEYGPTEATVGCIIYGVDPSDHNILIGKPIANTQIYILTDSVLAPIGVIGEVYISGSGLARGYLNREDLTSEKFVAHPFKKGELMYKTGDLGRWLSDGNIEYKGRIDDQVKIRGHRIELGEIERNLTLINGISQAVVIVDDKAVDKFLIAYYVPEIPVDKKELQSGLSKVLPDYMLPLYYVELDHIPLTINGKVDRKSLPEVSDNDLIKSEYVAPRSLEEKLLVEVWSEVLKHDSISIKDSFYNLGGDSIKSIQVVSRLKQRGFSLKIEHILRNPVIEDLAKLMTIDLAVIDQSTVKGEVALTPIQYSFFENKNISNKNYYNQSVLLKSSERLDAAILEQSIKALVSHHDALRMVYKFENDSWSQYNEDTEANHYKIHFHDLQNTPNEQELLTAISQELQSGFDLGSGVLFHIGHFKMSDGDRLALIAHHLIIDGVSWRILLEDFTALYESYRDNTALKLPLKTDSFQRWASHQKEYAKSKKAQKEREYWQELSNSNQQLPVLEAELKGGGSIINSSEHFVLDASVTQKLQTQINQVYNTDINDILLTGLALAIRDVFSIGTSVIKMEGHGREEIIDGIDVSRTVGWFTSVYPIVLNLKELKDHKEVLVEVKETLRRIPNKGIGYGILNYLDKPFENELIPTIQFNYLGEFGEELKGQKEQSVFEFSSENIGSSSDSSNNVSDVLLDISGMIVSGKLNISIRYSDEKYSKNSIKKIIDSYENQLRNIITDLSASKENKLTPSDLTYKGLTFSELSEINKNNTVEDIYQLSPLQQGLYYVWLLDRSSPVYFEQMAYSLNAENLSIAFVQKAFNELVSRYSVLRTSFTNSFGNIPLQIVHKEVTADFSYEKRPENATETIDEYIGKIKENDKLRGFDFENPSLIRLKVLEIEKDKYTFIWSNHHILMDGWCASILINDFTAILKAMTANQVIKLAEPVKYSEYINWLSNIDKESSLQYWRGYLKDLEFVTDIPFISNKEKETKYTGNQEILLIENELYQNVVGACKEIGITPNIFMQGVWGYLLSRYNNTQDVTFGSVVSGRPGELSGIEDMVGLFINTIPVRLKYESGDTSKSLLKKLQAEAIQSASHHYINLSEVQSESELGLDLIKSLMVFENYVIHEALHTESHNNEDSQNITIENLEVFEQTDYNFNIIIATSPTSFKLKFKYNAELFDTKLIKNLVSHFHHIVNQFSSSNDILLDQIDYISSVEQEQLLFGFNDTKALNAKDKTLVDLFEEQAEKTPHNIAVVFENKTLTYQQLNEQSNQLAGYLKSNYSIKPDDLIAIRLERNEFLLVSLLGVLKSGAAYVPIDSNYPQQRIDYIEKDSNSKVVINQNLVNDFLEVEDNYSTSNLGKNSGPNHLAYIIYTSGTTGNPKGVMIEHQNAVELINWSVKEYDADKFDIVYGVTSHCFDLSVYEFFYTLSIGKKLRILKNALEINNYLDQDSNILLNTVPSVIRKLIEDKVSLDNVSVINMAGEVLPTDIITKLPLDKIEVRNLYGPSEDTTYSTSYFITSKEAKSISIGKPIANTQVLILDDKNQLVPVGVTGRIFVSGAGVARGYLNKPELTQEKFVINSFIAGERMYDTGDLGYWGTDGNIEYIGRKDHQVKIRGYRIELGEIESAILGFSDQVQQAVLEAKEINSQKVLVAYYVSAVTIDKSELRIYLQGKLPDYMIPGYFMELDKMPLTPNGKIDRKALPEVSDKDLIKSEYVAARSLEEKLLVEIWSEVLKRDSISIKDSFYNLGGDSIKSIQVVSRLKQRGFSLKIEHILRNPVIKDLAKLMTIDLAVIDQSTVKGEVALTPIQYSFFENENISNKNYYNQTVLLKSNETLDAAILEQSIKALVSHHDALRMVYKFENGLWSQYNEDTEANHYKIHFNDLQNTPNEQELLTAISQELQSGFDLGSGVLFHIGHFKMSDGDRLALIVHHLIIDGASWRILLKDFTALYESYRDNTALKLPLKTDSFQRWGSHQKEYAKSKKAQKEREYWQELSNSNQELPVLEPEVKGEEGSVIDSSEYLVLEASLTQKLLTQIHQVYNTDINDILLTGLALTIREFFSIETSVIKMEGQGREKIIDGVDVSRTVGWFTSVYPIVLDLKELKDHKEVLVEVKETLRRIPNKGIGYGILNYLDKPFENKLIPTIQFNYLGEFGEELKGQNEQSVFEFSEGNNSLNIVDLDPASLLNISAITVLGQLRISISYSESLFSSNTIKQLLASYDQILKNLTHTLIKEETSHLTPSDLLFKGLTVKELNSINYNNNVEDVYILSPLQNGIYYHWLLDDSMSLYFNQMSYKINVKSLDTDAIKEAYDNLVQRYSVLRTSFTNDLANVPLQIVYHNVPSSFSYEEIPAYFDDNQIKEHVESIKMADRLQGFNLEVPSQIRLKVLDFGNGLYEFIWSHHHIITDGWCLDILINDFYLGLQAIQSDKVVNLAPPQLYSTYIEWLMNVDQEASLQYWKNYLSGYDKVAEIPFRQATVNPGEEIFERCVERLTIDGKLYADISALCNQLQITQSTFMLSVWGYLLSKYNDTQDVVFGTVVSGRPANLPGIEEMVGLFINTIPVRVKYDLKETPSDLLIKVQKNVLEGTDHHYVNLAEIQSESGAGMNLINHIMVFENLTAQELSVEKAGLDEIDDDKNFNVDEFDKYRESNYDFEIALFPSASSIMLEFQYNGKAYNSSSIVLLMNQLFKLSGQFSFSPDHTLESIDTDFNDESAEKLKNQNRMKLSKIKRKN